MPQNHLKIEHPEFGNRCHGYQNVRRRCHLQGETLSEVYFMSIHHLWTFRVDLRCDIDNLWLREPISGHKTRVAKTVNLCSYLRFCGNIMCTAGPNGNLWLTKATRMDTNGSDMSNGSNRALFRTVGGTVGPHGGRLKNWDFVVMDILEIKIIIFICLPVTEGCDSFPKHLDLTLSPNKTNEGVKKQWNT